MGATLVQSRDIGSVQRNDHDITTVGQALINKIIVAGAGAPTMTQTGVDAGTGDVILTFAAGGGGGGITRSINVISTTTTGAAVALTDYVYLMSGTFTYTQPTAVGNTNRYTLKNTSTGIITVVFTGIQTGDGSTTITLNANEAIDLISDNTNYNVI